MTPLKTPDASQFSGNADRQGG